MMSSAEGEVDVSREEQAAASVGGDGAAQLTDAEHAVLDLIDGFNRIDLDAILRCFADDAVYHNLPVDPVKGERAIRGVLEGFMTAASEVRWELLNMAVSPSGAVLTERIDRFKINNRWIALPVMGTFEVTDGLITHWRDYFDMAQFTSQVEATRHE